MVKIGIVGQFCSGKDAIADILVEEHKFKHFSLSDELRVEARKKKKKFDRKYLQDLGNKLREKEGADLFARRVLAKAKKEGDYVFTSIRNLKEAETLNKEGVVLIRVVAPERIRYERALSRKREGEKEISFSEWKEQEERENSQSEAGMQVRKVEELATIVIANDNTPEVLRNKVQRVVDDLRNKMNPDQVEDYTRPSWDEYFMELAAVVGKRGTCNRGRAGTVIVRDNRILVTGYVGSPVGLPHCDEVGHQLKKTIHEDGTISTHCVRTAHSEQNAICQAARMGISLQGATLYTKMAPCFSCAKSIINAGITRVVASKDYHAAEDSKKIFKQAGVKFELLSKDMTMYTNM